MFVKQTVFAVCVMLSLADFYKILENINSKWKSDLLLLSSILFFSLAS